ncbi:MAG: molybdopterin-guanine dinucleotide biosynthesis protein B [Halobacteriovoraceae bacterium]|jgi:molybdenum cofactor guanylyltransferase|nr:molybdopterin-guanine dinucleotide biosynthesis protein B [Halobacteriovoraceae bacterium]MBT5096057.1 molybdopterin-guanine dinucleotide biosynthesis protein B [Halobacteriovoraceae bacterium]
MLKNQQFHPFEMAFCGLSGSGKSTLIQALLKKLTPHFKIGYIKHDAHKFEIDKPGKDTERAKASGANQVYINNSSNWASHGDKIEDRAFERYNFLLNDFVIIEGYKKSAIPKFIFVNGESPLQADQFENVIAVIGEKENCSYPGYTYYQRDQVDLIAKAMLKYWRDLQASVCLKGLILTGGRSSRMGSDKGALAYHGVNQIDYLQSLLNPHCEEVLVSCREDQAQHYFTENHQQLHDRFLGLGPSGGILSALQSDPNSAWLVIACDLPHLKETDLEQLIKNRDPFKMATTFENPEKGWPEPLCAIWEPHAYPRLLQYVGLGWPCPRKVLMNSNIKTIIPENKIALENANTPEDFSNAVNKIDGSVNHAN